MRSLPAVAAVLSFALFGSAAFADDNRVSGHEAVIGPWEVLVDANPVSGRGRALAALDDQGHGWTLMVRCLDGQIGMLIRPYDQQDEAEKTIRRYAGQIQVDGGAPIQLSAQTFSAGGLLVIDAGPALGLMASGSKLRVPVTLADGSKPLRVLGRGYEERTGAGSAPSQGCRGLIDAPIEHSKFGTRRGRSRAGLKGKTYESK